MSRNHNITNIYTNEKPQRNITNNCIDNNYNNSDISSSYQALYKRLKGIIQNYGHSSSLKKSVILTDFYMAFQLTNLSITKIIYM